MDFCVHPMIDAALGFAFALALELAFPSALQLCHHLYHNYACMCMCICVCKLFLIRWTTWATQV